MKKNENRIYIFDTTLRDGEQSPGATLNIEEKVEIAHQLSRLGVDIIEAGFPQASQGDFEAVKRIAAEVEGPVICGLARTRTEDIDRCWEAIKPAKKPRIHTFIATSDIHLKHKLQKSRAEVKEIARSMVAHAAALFEKGGVTPDIEFSPEDAGRSDPEYLYEVLEAVIEAGARTLNIPDTVGYTVPEEFGKLIAGIKKNVRGIDKAIISVHCHNDLGLATANSLAAVMNGARQVECTLNGIGERAGNASLEEIVMIFKTREKLLGYHSNIDTTQIYKTSRMVSSLTGMLVQPNKAIVGANAFAHEAGIHQHGILMERTTYEIMDAKDIGLTENLLVLGKHSGRHAFKARLEEMGYHLSEEDLNKAFSRFKELADKKKEISDRDLESIVSEEIRSGEEIYQLESLHVLCGSDATPKATVKIKDAKGHVSEATVEGNGPVDSAYKAVDSLVTAPARKLMEYSVQSVTAGIDALAEVSVRVESEGRTYSGHGGDTDIVVASVKAYLQAINRLLNKEGLATTKIHL